MFGDSDMIRAWTSEVDAGREGASPDELIRLAVSTVGGAVVARARGEVDISCQSDWEQRLERACALASPPGPVVVDLDGLVFLGACGLRALENAWQRCWGHGVVLRLATRKPLYTRMLRLVDASRVLEVFPSVEAALAAPVSLS